MKRMGKSILRALREKKNSLSWLAPESRLTYAYLSHLTRRRPP